MEIDNEVELTLAGSPAGPRARFRISLVMWSNFLRFVPPEGIAVEELAERSMAPMANVRSTLGGLERWGYVVVGTPPSAGRRDGYGSGRRIRADTVTRPTRAGQRAQATWPDVVGAIEQRWRARFAPGSVDALRRACVATVGRRGRALPFSPPIVGPGNGFVTEVHPAEGAPPPLAAELPLAALLAQVLTAFTTEAEAGSPASLPIGANVLRMGEETVAVRDLPLRAGISKEAVAMAVGWLQRRGWATVAPDPATSRTKALRLTADGLAARGRHLERVGAIEQRWRAELGPPVVEDLRRALEAIVDQRAALAAGLVPGPGCWRGERPYSRHTGAIVADPRAALPHHPMVLHRGGWPDGS
jgi:DNA-binding MarR family transcriptional regulator